MSWTQNRVNQVNEKQLSTAKTIAIILRYVKLFSEFVTITAAIVMLNTWLTLAYLPLHTFVTITWFFLVVDYAKKMLNVRGFVDDKFRKEISNNCITSNEK